MQSHKWCRTETELAASHQIALFGNDEVCTAANIKQVETELAASHQIALDGNYEVCTAANIRQAETELAASHKMEHSESCKVHCVH